MSEIQYAIVTTIRAAVPGDAEALSRLAIESKAHWGYAPEVVEGWREQLTIRAHDIEGKPTYVAELAGEIAGFYSLARSEAHWELDNLWVHPRLMHRGIGKALVAHARETAARGGASELRVDADPNAERFYIDCGAVRRGEIPAPIPGEPQRTRPQLAFTLFAEP